MKKLDFTNSTAPELLRLAELFPDLESIRGTVIEFDTIEKALGLERDSNRFKTVISRWRADTKKNKGIWMRGNLPEVIGIGIRVLTHDEQVEFSGIRYRQAGRKIVDGHAAAANTDDAKLSPEAIREKEHRILAGRHLHAAVIESRRFLPKAVLKENRPEVNAPVDSVASRR